MRPVICRRARALRPVCAPIGGSASRQKRAPITDVLGRFVRAYLAGDTGALEYLVSPGTTVAAAAGRCDLLSLGSVVDLGGAPGGGRLVAATVHVRDAVSRVAYWLRYRVRVVHRDRWCVAEIDGPGREVSADEFAETQAVGGR